MIFVHELGHFLVAKACGVKGVQAKTMDELVAKMPKAMAGFANVPEKRWRAFAERLYIEVPKGLHIRYDPELRTSFLAAFEGPEADLWPLFDACAGLPLALIRGANSDLLSEATAEEMRRRRPDMAYASVPDRAHVPFLDEAESLAALTGNSSTSDEGARP